jgi:hypothetical protein
MNIENLMLIFRTSVSSTKLTAINKTDSAGTEASIEHSDSCPLSFSTPKIVSYSVIRYRMLCVARTQLTFKLYVYFKLEIV